MAKKRDDGNEITEEILSKLEKDIQKEYKQAYKEVRKKLKDFTEAYEAERKQKLQDIKNGTITYKEYREWCERKIFVSKRWEAMKETLADDLANADRIARSMAVEHSPEVYSVNHSFAGYQVSRDAAINPSFTIYNRRAVETLIRDKPDLLPVASKKMDIPKDKRWNEKKINSVVTQSILQGKPIDDVADSLIKVVGMDMSAAVRNARTMITNAQNRGRQDAFDELKEKGIPLREKWIATLDNRTRHSHRLMHGVYKGKDGYYPNGLRYPGDELGDPEEVYNCRCTEIAEVGEFAIDTPMHSSKMGEMTFDEWIQEGTGKADWYEAYNSDDWEIPDNKWKFEDQEDNQDLKEEDQEIQEEELKEEQVPWDAMEYINENNISLSDLKEYMPPDDYNQLYKELFDSALQNGESASDYFKKIKDGTYKNDKSIELLNSLTNKEMLSDKGYALLEWAKTFDIERIPLIKLDVPKSVENFINDVGGGDLTKGSCASLSFCFAANNAGYDIRDFKGGASRIFFSAGNRFSRMAQLSGVKSFSEFSMKPIKTTVELLKKIPMDTPYILGVGKHAAVVEHREDGYRYLELQAPQGNGWYRLTTNELSRRFGATKTTKYGDQIDLIEVESLSKNPYFLELMEFINTEEGSQQKGEYGRRR